MIYFNIFKFVIHIVVGFVPFVFVPGLSITWMYWQIYSVVKRHRCQIKKMARLHVPSAARGEHTRKRTRSLSRDLRAVKLLSLLLASFLVSWGPFFTESFYTMLCECRFNKVAYCTTVTLTFAKSLCNPFLYAFGRREVRNAILTSFPCTKLDRVGEDGGSYVSTND